MNQNESNKAQHSPLPWRVGKHTEAAGLNWHDIVTDGLPFSPSFVGEAQLEDAKLIVRAVNHADKLAKALRELSRLVHQNNALQHAGLGVSPEAWSEMYQATNEAKAQLAAYEAAQ